MEQLIRINFSDDIKDDANNVNNFSS